MQSLRADEAVALVVRLAGEFSDRPLPADTPAKILGDTPMSTTDRARIVETFEDAVRSPRLTVAQRRRLQRLVNVVLAHDVPDPAPPSADGTPPPHAVMPGKPRGQDVAAVAPRKWWPVVAGALVLLASLGATSWLAWTNFRTGRDWQDRAAAATADLDRLGTENDTLEGDLADLEEALERSEVDVTLLERRLSRAANEKARVEDEREQVTALAERITEVALAYDDVASWFSACREEQSALTSMVFEFESYYLSGQTYLVSSQIDRAAETCRTAEQQLAGLRSYIAGLAP